MLADASTVMLSNAREFHSIVDISVIPGGLLVLALAIASALSHGLDLIPPGMSFSVGRTCGAVLIGLLAYPAGFFLVLIAMLSLLSFSKVDPPGTQMGALGLLIAYLTLLGILFAAEMLVVLIITAGFAVGVRHWPRRAFGPMIRVVVATLAGAMIAGMVHYGAQQTLPAETLVRNALTHPLETLFAVAWGSPLAALVGTPLVAALMGHWFYQAGAEWSAEQA